jgi:hypothetical protein
LRTNFRRHTCWNLDTSQIPHSGRFPLPQGLTEDAPDHDFLSTIPFIDYGSTPEARMTTEVFGEGHYAGNYYEPTQETKIYKFQAGLIVDLIKKDN